MKDDDNDDPKLRMDSWANLLTGVGTPASDNRLAWYSMPDFSAQQSLEYLWRGDGLAGRIVELPADDMTRERGTVRLGEGLTEEEAQLQRQQQELNMWPLFRQAICYARAYGGAGLILALNDGQNWDKPVNLSTLQSVDAIHLASPIELVAMEWYTDPRNPLRGQPKLYRWSPYGVPMSGAYNSVNMLVHQSRVLKFVGTQTSITQRVQRLGWGDALLGRVRQRITDTMSAVVGAGVIVQDFSQAVLGLTGLRELLSTANGNTALQRRIEGMRMARSALGVLVIDKDEKYERQPTPIAGLADLLDTFLLFVSTETGIPVQILTGQAQTGLGDNTTPMARQWEGWVRAQQNLVLRPVWHELSRLQLSALTGPTRGRVPPKLEVCFSQLLTPTPSEAADLELKVAQKDQINITSGLYTAEEAARSHYSGATFDPKISLDLSTRDPLAALPEFPADLPQEVLPAPAVPILAAPPTATRPPAVKVDVLEAPVLGGPQVHSVQEVVLAVAGRTLPRSSGVAILQECCQLSVEAAESIMGEVGRTFFSAAGDGAPAFGRSDAVDEYATLLAAESKVGEITAEEVARKLARLYRVPLSQGRALLREKLKAESRADALPAAGGNGPTNFPRRSMNEPVALTSSEHAVFDPSYAMALRDDWPELWSRASSWDRQFERLLPVARGGGAVHTAGEDSAVRLREAWARTYASGRTLASVVAQVKHLVVGKLGEEGMKALLEQQKERIRRRRKEAQP